MEAKDRPVLEIEITPEMIEAGRRAIISNLGLFLDETVSDQRLESAVREVFRLLFHRAAFPDAHEPPRIGL